MEDKLLEQMAEKVHDAWAEEKKRQGFHHPDDCPTDGKIKGVLPVWKFGAKKPGYEEFDCPKCHKDMKPYAELSENVKHLDRRMVIKFEILLEELGYAIGRDYSKE